MVEYLKIRNWDKWQTYRKDRGQPPWIKIHREVMRNIDWVSLTDGERGQLVSIWLLAADHGGVIPASPEVIQKLCYMTNPPNLNKFTALGFIDNGWRQTGVKPASNRRQHDHTEAEAEAEAEAEYKETEPDGSDPSQNLPNHYSNLVPEWLPKLDLLSSKFKDLPQRFKVPFNPYQFIQKYIVKEGYHPEVVFNWLTSIYKYWEKIKDDPWKYSRKGIHKDQQLKEHEGYKRITISDLAPEVQKLLTDFTDRIKEPGKKATEYDRVKLLLGQAKSLNGNGDELPY